MKTEADNESGPYKIAGAPKTQPTATTIAANPPPPYRQPPPAHSSPVLPSARTHLHTHLHIKNAAPASASSSTAAAAAGSSQHNGHALLAYSSKFPVSFILLGTCELTANYPLIGCYLDPQLDLLIATQLDSYC